VAFDFDNAVKVKESKESSSVTGNFDFDNAVKVPTNNNGMTAYDEWVYSEFDQDISKSLLKDMSEDDAGKAEFYRDKSKADFNAGIAEMDKIKSTEDVLTGKFWAGAIPYTKAVAGLFTRPFGVEPLADVTPEKLATIQKEHKVAYTIGDVVGGYAPFIAASVLFPQTLLASTSIFAGMGGLRESGRVKMEESMLTSGIKNAADIAKETVKMGLYAPIWHYSKALTFIGKPIVSALAIAGTRGAGVATLHKVFGEDLESALKQGGLIMGLSLVFELPMLGKTALGRGIINKAERDVFRKFGVKVKVNRGVVDASSERTSLFKLVKLFGQSMKHKVTKANTPNPKVENVQRHLTPKQGIEIVNPKTLAVVTPKADLSQQAKGKTLEEFVEGQGKPLYHGSGKKFDKFDESMRGTITGAKSAKGAIWFTDNPKVAKGYSIFAAERGVVNEALEKASALEKKAQMLQAQGKTKEANKLFDEADKFVVQAEELDKYDATFERRKLADVKEVVLKEGLKLQEIDAKGKTPQELSADDDIDSWLNSKILEAKKSGKDGLVIKNLDDAAGLYNVPSTHYAIFDSANINTKAQLTSIWEKAQEKKTPSKVARSIEAKAIEEKLTKAFEDKAGFDPVTVKEQARLTDELIKNDLDKAIKILKGEKPVPQKLRAASVITGLENYAIKTGDASLMKDLAESPLVAETSRYAQELRLLAERDPESPVSAIQEVVKVREKRAEKRSKKTTSKTKKGSTKDLKESIKKSAPSKDAWVEFIKELEC